MVRRMAVAILVATIVFGGVRQPVGAQERLVRFDGRVQWIAGQLMTVQLDSGGSASVDLLHVPQDQYLVLTRGERIVVFGIVSDGRRRVIGTSVVRASGDSQAP